MSGIEEHSRTEIEAAVFRHLVKHLQNRTDVQNIDLMNLANFCRNCLSKWYLAEAEKRGLSLDYEQVRESIYGMTYSQWKSKYQKEMTAEQKAIFESKGKL